MDQCKCVKHIKNIRWEIKVGYENNWGTDQKIITTVGQNLSYTVEKKWEFLQEKGGSEEEGTSEGEARNKKER